MTVLKPITFFSYDLESGLEPRIVVDNNVAYDDEESRKLMEKQSNFETGVNDKIMENNSRQNNGEINDTKKTTSNQENENVDSSSSEYVPGEKVDQETHGQFNYR